MLSDCFPYYGPVTSIDLTRDQREGLEHLLNRARDLDCPYPYFGRTILEMSMLKVYVDQGMTDANGVMGLTHLVCPNTLWISPVVASLLGSKIMRRDKSYWWNNATTANTIFHELTHLADHRPVWLYVLKALPIVRRLWLERRANKNAESLLMDLLRLEMADSDKFNA